MIFHCLRHWVYNYHIDGFRFDLASILNRNRDGELVPNPPLVEMIAEDPMLAERGTRPGPFRWVRLPTRAGPSGTGCIATMCAVFGEATMA